MKSIKKQLAVFSRKTIRLDELEDIMKEVLQTYEDFAEAILELEAAGILNMVKSKGRTSRVPSLAFLYRINKSLLAESHHKQLQQYRLNLHPLLNLDYYYNQDPSIWDRDRDYIIKLDNYIKTEYLPIEPVPAPERSFELVGDEKWITEKGGKELLERVGLFDRLNIIPVSEPLMFAINPDKVMAPTQYHLIVENKTTYQGLLPALPETVFATLIYGAGKAVIKCMEQFPLQYPVEANHQFYYFGDLDREGISIWYSLFKKHSIRLALPFYLVCLEKEMAKGKEYQKENKEAQDRFLSFFKLEQQQQIHSLLKNGFYHPQETLKTRELQEIWRKSNWTS
ncbi:Wadjet anti-phage system protein JetD domain-containing protein [Paucisalibacillus globulus]|uniref:Wadjet anti-phage system protein JetD domain-containing protein n=1 Tax=Paucisalibacillus globulus TaxID=351095 RepID=UPI0003F8B96A|nr:Wadjet anti-phage system protein JetD domain-containing protein [Paucisalibacillus globulus]